MFHLDLKLLRSVAVVAACGSVTRAAERLHLSQPTISGQIKELEQQLGFVVFHRTTRRMELSAEGKRILPIIEAVLGEAERLRIEIEEMQLTGATRFRLGAAMFSLDFDDRLRLLDDFAAAAPEIRYSIDNRLQHAQVRDLLGARLDAALLLGIAVPMETEPPATGPDLGLIVNETVYPDSLDRVVLERRPIRLLVPAESDLARQDSIPLSALGGLPVAMLSTEHGEAMVGPIAKFLTEAGAQPIWLAEGNALAVERYAIRHRMAAIGVGWFATPPDMVLRDVETMNFHMDLAIVLGVAPNKAARRFFSFAKSWQAARVKGATEADPPADRAN